MRPRTLTGNEPASSFQDDLKQLHQAKPNAFTTVQFILKLQGWGIARESQALRDGLLDFLEMLRKLGISAIVFIPKNYRDLFVSSGCGKRFKLTDWRWDAPRFADWVNRRFRAARLENGVMDLCNLQDFEFSNPAEFNQWLIVAARENPGLFISLGNKMLRACAATQSPLSNKDFTSILSRRSHP